MTARTRAHGSLLAIAMLAGVLAGCGGGNDSNNNSQNNATPSQGTAGDTFGITSSNRLVSFSRTSPATGTAIAVTGLQANENLLAIDLRPGGTPAGQLIAIGSNGGVYSIDPNSGAATLKSTMAPDSADTDDNNVFTSLTGTRVSIDFNNVVDQLRVVTNTGLNLRVKVDSGLTSADPPLTVGSTTSYVGVTEVTYTNNFATTCRNTVYYLDTTADRLMTSANASGGILTAVGGLTVDAAAMAGFDIATAADGTNAAFAVMTVNNVTSLYSINLMNGAALLVGGIGQLNAGETVLGLALPMPASTPSQAVGELLAVTEANRLVSFNSGAPSKLCTSATFTGLQGNETVYGVDLRPADGNVYALTSAARLYTVNPGTATAAFVAALTDSAGNPFTALSGNNFTIDISPTADAMRVLSDTGQNLAVGLPGNTALPAGVTATATNLTAGSSITASAYTNNIAGAGKSTLYVIDTAGDRLQIQGLPPAGSPPGTANTPNTGNLTTVAGLNGINGDVQSLAGFDINSLNNTAAAALNVGTATTSTLYTINLQTGAATLVGPIGVTERIRGMTYPNAPRTATAFGITADGRLVSFNPATPATFIGTPTAITGMQGGERIIGFDNRPANNTLYILTDGGRIYSVNPSNASATLIQATMTAGPFNGGKFGTDFSPPADALRVISDAEQNLAVFADNATLPAGTTAVQTQLTRSAGDAGTLPAPNVIAVAYSNNFSPANGTSLYDIDLGDGSAASGRLLSQNPAMNGVITAIGLLDPTATTAFQNIGEIDIAGGEDGIAIAALIPNGQSQSILYRVNLGSGALTAVGPIGPAGTQLIGLTIRLQ